LFLNRELLLELSIFVLFSLWGGIAKSLTIQSFGCGAVWFFGLGSFLVAVGMGGVKFCPMSQYGWMLGGMGRERDSMLGFILSGPGMDSNRPPVDTPANLLFFKKKSTRVNLV
jgi:hypothetical protein